VSGVFVQSVKFLLFYFSRHNMNTIRELKTLNILANGGVPCDDDMEESMEIDEPQTQASSPKMLMPTSERQAKLPLLPRLSISPIKLLTATATSTIAQCSTTPVQNVATAISQGRQRFRRLRRTLPPKSPKPAKMLKLCTETVQSLNLDRPIAQQQAFSSISPSTSVTALPSTPVQSSPSIEEQMDWADGDDSLLAAEAAVLDVSLFI